MTAEELLERYAAGERFFTDLLIQKGNFIRADLRGINLRDIVFSNSDLITANFTEANFDGFVIFRDCDLTSADFTGAEMNGTQFSGSKLVGACFTGAELTRSKFLLRQPKCRQLCECGLSWSGLQCGIL